MIPKIIHYCWFGHGKKPRLIVKCMRSWRKKCPDYQIIEWNEDNYDISCAPLYVKQAYAEKKWAFVTDYIRFELLYKIGGIYLDTDVELIKPIDTIVSNGPFMGCENSQSRKTLVAPGLVLAAEPGMMIYKEILDSYTGDCFIKEDGTLNLRTVVVRVTSILKRYGLIDTPDIQNVAGMNIYPYDYFGPMDPCTREMHHTENTVAIHWYMASWQTKEEILLRKRWIRANKLNNQKEKIRSVCIKVLGDRVFSYLRHK